MGVKHEESTDTVQPRPMKTQLIRTPDEKVTLAETQVAHTLPRPMWHAVMLS